MKLPEDVREFFRRTGKIGAEKRHAGMSPKRRREVARIAANARWAKIKTTKKAMKSKRSRGEPRRCIMQAYVYARVSSREQEREGYSIPAQRKLLSEYASSHGFEVIQVFVDVESAKNPGRKEFGNMVRLLHTQSQCRIVLVEKPIVFIAIARTA